MTDIEGEITPETILRQCIVMSKNSRLDAYFYYFGYTDSFDVIVRIDAEYKEDKEDKIIYRAKYGGAYNKTSLVDIYQALVGIEFEYCEKQTALDEERSAV